jgi:predicted esterase
VKVRKHKKLRIAALILLAVILLLAGGFYIYTLDYYRADDTAVEALAMADQKTGSQGSVAVFMPASDNDRHSAFIFYPGGKVAHDAYAPLMLKLAREGVTCVLVKMPFNLAVFDTNAADRVFQLLPDIKNWYIGGHSLGGAMASSYAGANSDKLKGLVLLAAYPLKTSELPTLTVYGSEDQVLDKSKLDGLKNVLEITGGNHAYFGNYGEQKGDGTASITREEQQAQTVAAIVRFIDETCD